MKNEIVKKIKECIKLVGIVVFLYIALVSISNFWGGLHDLDLAFNMINLGYSMDIGTDGLTRTLQEVYLGGLSSMRSSFIWVTLDLILGVFIGYCYKGGKN